MPCTKALAPLVILILVNPFLSGSSVATSIPDQPNGQGSLTISGQIGGPTQAVAVAGNYALVGVGTRLVVVDITNPSSPSEVGATAPLASDVTGIAVSGTVAFVADGPGGLYAVSIQDVTHPKILESFTPLGYAEKVTVAGHLAYLADGPAGLLVVNATDPTHLSELSSAYGLDYAFDVAVAGSFAYVAAGGAGLLIADITNPARITESGSLGTPGYAFGVATSGTFAYVADGWGGLCVVDTSGSSPRTVGSGQAEGWAMRVVVSGGTAYVADEYAGLAAFNVVNPSSPQLTWDEGPYNKAKGQSMGQAVDIALAGGEVLLADRVLGLRIIDVTGLPKSARQLAGFNEFGFGGYVGVSGSYGFAVGITSTDDSLKVLNLTDTSNIRSVSVAQVPSEIYRGILVEGSTAFLLGANSVEPTDVSNPAKPVVLSTVNIVSPTVQMGIYGGMAYVTTEFDWELVNVTNPSSAKFVGLLYDFTGGLGRANQTATPGPLAAYDGVAYGTWTANVVYSMNVTNPSAPKLISTYRAPSMNWPLCALMVGNYLYLGDHGQIDVVDVSKPGHPAEVSVLPITGQANDMSLAGNLLYVAAGDGGLEVVDTTNPASPTIKESLALPTQALSVAASANGILVGSGNDGLYSVDPVAPTANPARQGAGPRTSSAGAQASQAPIDLVSFVSSQVKGALTAPVQSGQPAADTTWKVNSSADSGTGTLRWALTQAKSGDVISFDPSVFPPSNPASIRPKSALPAVTQGDIRIDGVGAGVILNGSGTPSGTNGLLITSSYNTIMGIQVYDFTGAGIGIANGSYNVIGGNRTLGQGNVVSGNVGDDIGMAPCVGQITTDLGAGGCGGVSDHNQILGNFIGTDPAGEHVVGKQGAGVFLVNGPSNNVIGGQSPSYRNVIDGGIRDAVSSVRGHDNVIEGNYVGIDASGSKALGNQGDGVVIEGGQRNLVLNNLISGDLDGVSIHDPGAEGNVVQGNLIGTDATGTRALGNVNNGVGVSESFNLIGGLFPSDRNIISGNSGEGIGFATWPVTTGVVVIGNYIGTDITGTKFVQGAQVGIDLNFGCVHNFIGGVTAGEGNVIISSSLGIKLEGSERFNVVTGNRVQIGAAGARPLSPSWGIQVIDSTYNYLQANQISGANSTGLMLYSGANFNVVRSNNVSRSSLGMFVTGNDNTITANDLTNPTNAYDGGTGNQWSYGKSGNYWSDYKGTDGGNGIGTTPYQISPNGVDSFPMTKPDGGRRSVWLTLETSVPDLQVKVNGTATSTDSKGGLSIRLGYFSTCNLTVPSTLQQAGSTRAQLVSLNGIGTPSEVVRLYENRTILASYLTQFLVSVSSAYGNTSGSGWYEQGSDVTIEQTTVQLGNSTREVFVNWSGVPASEASSPTIPVSAPLNLTANWVRQYLLTVVSSFSPTIGGGWYNQGANATFSVQSTTFPINATAYAKFYAWTGAVNSTAPSVTITMNGPASVTALWKEYTLEVTTTSTTSTTATVPTTTVTSSSASSTTATSSSRSSNTTSTTFAASTTQPVPTTTSTTAPAGGGIPEFPEEITAAACFTALVLASYLISRRRR